MQAKDPASRIETLVLMFLSIRRWRVLDRREYPNLTWNNLHHEKVDFPSDKPKTAPVCMHTLIVVFKNIKQIIRYSSLIILFSHLISTSAIP